MADSAESTVRQIRHAARDTRGAAREAAGPVAGEVSRLIARDGDRGIRDANACIDAYNAVRDTLNQAQQ